MDTNRNNHRKRSNRCWQTVLGLLVTVVLMTSCSRDAGNSVILPDGAYEVRLLIDAGTAATDTRAEGDVSVIRELRIYAFNDNGERIGYYYNGSLSANGTTYYVPFRLSEGGNVDFYVVANESGAGLSLTETMAKTALEALEFQAAEVNDHYSADGDLLCGKAQTEITAANQSGEQIIVPCQLSRPFSLLDVRFAKTSDVLEVVITDVNLYDYTTAGTVFENDSYTLTYVDGSLNLFSSEAGAEVAAITTTGITDVAAYGTPFATQAVAPNTSGTGEWMSGNTDWETAPGEQRKPRLVVNYEIEGVERVATIYLPPIETNHRYGVNSLISADGLTLNLNVLPWEKESSEIVWSDTPVFEIENVNQSVAGEEGGKYYPIRYTVTNNPDDTNDFYFTFKLSSPEGMRWVASIDNGQDFFFCDPAVSSPSMTDNYVPGGYAVGESGTGVYIRLKAFGPYNESNPQQVRLAIRFQAADGTWNRLMINEDENNNLLTSSGARDVILIKQIPN